MVCIGLIALCNTVVYGEEVHDDGRFARHNGTSSGSWDLGTVQGGWHDGNIGLMVYLINPDGTPYSKHSEVYDFYYA